MEIRDKLSEEINQWVAQEIENLGSGLDSINKEGYESYKSRIIAFFEDFYHLDLEQLGEYQTHGMVRAADLEKTTDIASGQRSAVSSGDFLRVSYPISLKCKSPRVFEVLQTVLGEGIHLQRDHFSVVIPVGTSRLTPQDIAHLSSTRETFLRNIAAVKEELSHLVEMAKIGLEKRLSQQISNRLAAS